MGGKNKTSPLIRRVGQNAIGSPHLEQEREDSSTEGYLGCTRNESGRRGGGSPPITLRTLDFGLGRMKAGLAKPLPTDLDVNRLTTCDVDLRDYDDHDLHCICYKGPGRTFDLLTEHMAERITYNTFHRCHDARRQSPTPPTSWSRCFLGCTKPVITNHALLAEATLIEDHCERTVPFHTVQASHLRLLHVHNVPIHGIICPTDPH
ncbi:hypothetical protein BDM02DRAFT_3117550 [Thelephora ganbajun]|uniref:Uncharacterized protein n=1 Tax=Thelephora ganbajun TaxID=370292 RepID=A0ACB6ZBY5_THEGA|nr:hypothetical protein BDM02DRAFT_3117550 [Thelephora ganbajun]